MSPFAEAGGIKDVVAGLSEALAGEGHEVTVVLPMYKFLKHYSDSDEVVSFPVNIGNLSETIRIYKKKYKSIRILFIAASCFTDKDQVYTYSNNEEMHNSAFAYGNGHLDCNLMNLVLQICTLETAFRLNEVPDIFHLHDGHCGFLPALMGQKNRYGNFFSRCGTLLTIHNAGVVYQQNISGTGEALELTGLPRTVLKKTKIKYGYSPLLCAGMFGHINTVSEQYASDIMSGTDSNSGILGKVFKREKVELFGITNGIDVGRYKNPVSGSGIIPDPVSGDMRWKQAYKELLFQRIDEYVEKQSVFGDLVHDSGIPLITMQSRITYQKGIDICLEGLESALAGKISANFLIVGEGEKKFENKLADLASDSCRFCYIKKYDNELSQLLFAAGDFFIIPSRWEPCGLTDFISQLYGNIPIVHKTGGLVKTMDSINGLSYRDNSGASLLHKIEEALDLYNNEAPLLYEMRKNAVNIINEKFTWQKVLTEGYLPLYRKIWQKKNK